MLEQSKLFVFLPRGQCFFNIGRLLEAHAYQEKKTDNDSSQFYCTLITAQLSMSPLAR